MYACVTLDLIYFVYNILCNQKRSITSNVTYAIIDFVLYNMLYNMLHRYKQDLLIKFCFQCTDSVQKQICLGNKQILATPAGLQITGEMSGIPSCSCDISCSLRSCSFQWNQVYHCKCPLQNIFKHTLLRHTLNLIQADTYFQLVIKHIIYFQKSLYSLRKDKK